MSYDELRDFMWRPSTIIGGGILFAIFLLATDDEKVQSEEEYIFERYHNYHYQEPKIEEPIEIPNRNYYYDNENSSKDFTDPVDEDSDEYDIDLGTGDPQAEEQYDFNRD